MMMDYRQAQKERNRKYVPKLDTPPAFLSWEEYGHYKGITKGSIKAMQFQGRVLTFAIPDYQEDGSVRYKRAMVDIRDIIEYYDSYMKKWGRDPERHEWGHLIKEKEVITPKIKKSNVHKTYNDDIFRT